MYLELYVNQRANFSHEFHLTDSQTLGAQNLSSTTISGKIKKSYFSANVAANLSCNVANSANGFLIISLGANVTSNLTPGRYVYDVIMAKDNNIERFLEGNMIVSAGVT
jgi:hypothetical protein